MSLIPFIIFFLILIAITILTSLYRIQKEKRLLFNKADKKLKEKGIKIRVDFSECQVISRSYFGPKENNDFPSWIDILDSLSKGRMQKEEMKTVSQISYKHLCGDEIITFKSKPIYMPETNLKFRLESKKFTYIYFDKDKFSNYYFDLEFLY